ncbi:MAG: toprim domain-containing protein [Butyricicoccaceae bacterium]
MIQIKEAIIVEGRYDVNKLKQLVDTIVIPTDGFGIFNNRQKLSMIRRIAEQRGVLILTDSDGAGFVIRNYLKGALPKDKVKHAYIPQIAGKERRKAHASKEGTLGVEGVSDEIILKALTEAGVSCETESIPTRLVTKADFYAWGLSGVPGSEEKRKKLLHALNLPQHMTANALLEFINAVSDYETVQQLAEQL